MTTVSYDFNVADNANVPNFTGGYDGGWASFAVVGNRIRCTNDASGRLETYDATFGNNQEASLTLASFAGGSGFPTLGVVLRSPAPTTVNFYRFIAVRNFSDTSLIGTVIGGSFVTISGDGGGTAWAATDIIKGRSDSSLHKLFRNDVELLSVTNGAIIAGAKIGIIGGSDTGNAAGDIEGDDFTGGDIAMPPGPITAPSLNCWMGGWW